MDKNLSLTVYDEQGKGNSLSLTYENKAIAVCDTTPGENRPCNLQDRGEIAEMSDAVISDDDDITFLGLVREYYPNIVRFFLSGQGSLKYTMNSINYPQIFSYLTDLWSSRELKSKISKAFGPYSLSMEDCTLKRLTTEQNQELSLINTNLKEMIDAPSLQLQEFVRDGIIMLAAFAESREDNTGGHVFRIRELTRDICEGLGLSTNETDDICFSSMMHDVGKIQLPDMLLLKPGPLNKEEEMEMQRHCAIGEKMLGDKPVYRTAREIARSHHEHWDGTGYPDMLKGASIPLSARITAIADAFDALTHERCYKKTWPAMMALHEMKPLSGRQFDPEIIDVFFKIQSGEIKTRHQAEIYTEEL